MCSCPDEPRDAPHEWALEEPADEARESPEVRQPKVHQFQPGQKTTLHIGQEESHLQIEGEETTAFIALPDGLLDELRRRGLRPENLVVSVAKLPERNEILRVGKFRSEVNRRPKSVCVRALRLPRARSSCGGGRPRHRRVARPNAPPRSDSDGEPHPPRGYPRKNDDLARALA